MKVAFNAVFSHPLPENHRFPMEKYDLLHQQLMHEGIVEANDFFRPQILDIANAAAVHTKAYLDRLIGLQLTPREQRVTGFPHSELLIRREMCIMEGTRACADFAFRNKGIAMNIAGGTHHAYAEKGEGFCLLNDNAIAAQWLLDQQLCQRVLIIDLDVHQGNGTAAIFKENPHVFTFSMHGAHNYPLHKEQSDLDVGLKDGTEDREYLYLLEVNLNKVIEAFTPDFIFYQCGVDILNTDKLGRLGVSAAGCKERDKIVFETARQLCVPVVCSMGGGYSPQIKNIVDAHANTFKVAQYILG